jgi:type III pantothenate kinase
MNHQNHPIHNLWLALIIGSSNLHWAWFQGQELLTAWDTPHLQPEIAQQLIEGNFADRLWPEIWPDPPQTPTEPPLWIASVVPEQTQLWQSYPQAKVITLNDLPLKGLYPTLGVDRALAVLGAGEKFGWPILVIDGGTALTFTGVDENRQLIGGAILPGFRLQLKSLWTGTASLPDVEIPSELPSRWGLNTPASIQSGVIYSIVAGVRDFIQEWWRDYPQSKIVITGGGGLGLLDYLKAQNSAIQENIDSSDSPRTTKNYSSDFPLSKGSQCGLGVSPSRATGVDGRGIKGGGGGIADVAISDPHLVFWGMETIVNR